MNCTETRSLLSQYLDGAITGTQMLTLKEHLSNCPGCNEQYMQLHRTHRLIAALGRRQPPPELALKLRLAISREAAAVRRPWYEGVRVRFEDAVRGMLVPATCGALSAIIVFGLLIGFFALPQSLQADNDVPTVLYTPTELKSVAYHLGMDAIEAEAVVVEAYVDQNGRVYDYKILSAPEDLEHAMPQLRNTLIFTQFRPATSFGRPVHGRAIVSFSRVNVKG